MADIWIVAANRTQARIFAYSTGCPVTELESLVCPEARQPVRSMLTDAAGRSHDRMGPARHSMEPSSGVVAETSRNFARRIAGRIEQGRVSHAWHKLVLVAGPRFLGVLRDELGPECRGLVLAEVKKNVVRQSVARITSSFPDELRRRLRMPSS